MTRMNSVCQVVAYPVQRPYDSGVAFNSATGFGDPTTKADIRPHGGFFTSVHRYRCAQSMAGRGGDTFGYAGFLSAGSPTLLRACPLRLATKGRPLTKEAFMPDVILAPVAHAFTAIAAVLAYTHRPVAAVTVLFASMLCLFIARGGRQHG